MREPLRKKPWSSRRRVRKGGKLAVGRDSATLEEWRAVKAFVAERSGGRCEACTMRPARDPHHVVKRSAGGADVPSNVIHLCRPCHDRTDAPFALGRLVIETWGAGVFVCSVVTKADKFA